MKVYGIRHHGPGSALRLKSILESSDHDVILIEGPSDANKMLRQMAPDKVTLPISLSALNTKDHQVQAHYPFAIFSPEWIAMTYAIESGTPFYFIDLPFTHQDASESLVRDPLKSLAEASGYSDAEKWWEVMFEHQEEDKRVFDQISFLIGQVRKTHASKREIYMMSRMHDYLQTGFKNPGIICGAWHAPILVKNDFDTAKYIKEVESDLDYFWLPWSYERLSVISGYGAGVRAPLYYEMLYRYPNQSTEQWLALAADTIRGLGHQISTAQMIEVARMSVQLAALRNRKIPGIDEFWDGLQSVLPEQKKSVLEIVRRSIFIGTSKGSIDPKVNPLPLLIDFYHCIKSFRLGRLKINGVDVHRKLDLRKPGHARLSKFLYRCLLLNLGWPQVMEAEINHTGHFFEYWDLTWNDDIDSRLVEASHLGTTIEEASIQGVMSRISEVDSLPWIWQRLEWTIRAGHSALTPDLLQKGKDLLAIAEDGYSSLEAWLSLHRIRNFIQIIDFDGAAIDESLDFLLPKIFFLLPSAHESLDDEKLGSYSKMLLQFHTVLTLKEERWLLVLNQMIQNPKLPPILSGLVLRLLVEVNEFSLQRARQEIQFQFSQGRNLESTAQWIDGYLLPGKLDIVMGSGMLDVMDGWLSDLEPEQFKNVVFGLRRSFNALTSEEKVSLQNNLVGKSHNEIPGKSDLKWLESPFLAVFQAWMDEKK